MKRFLAVLAMLLCFAGHSAIFNNTFTTQSTAGFSITGTNLSVPGVVRANGGAFTNSLTRNGIDAITGFGNVNLISRFTSANGIGSSSIGDDGVTVTMTEPLSLSAALTAQSGAFTNSLTLNGSPVLTNAPGSGITNAGTGTANTLAKWTDTNSLGNSTITDDGGGNITFGAEGASSVLLLPPNNPMGNGTDFQVQSGAPGVDGRGGDISFLATDGTGNGRGGNFNFTAGGGSGTGVGGKMVFAADADDGSISFSATGNNGAINLTADTKVEFDTPSVIPVGTTDLGTFANRWENIFARVGHFTDGMFVTNTLVSDGDIETTGNIQIRSVPYIWPVAQGDANTTLVNDGTGILTWTPLVTTLSQNGTNGGTTVNFTNSPTVTWARVGSNWTATAASGGSLSVNGTNVTTPNLTNTSTVTLAVSGSNILATAIVPAGTATASGTANTVAKFTSSTNLGNSSITDNGTTVALTSGITTVAGTQTNTASTTANVPFVAVGASGQTNDLMQWMSSAGTNYSKINSNGQLLLQAGTVSKPAIGWLADDDGSGTGLFRQSADAIGITTGGAERIRITSGGALHTTFFAATSDGNFGFTSSTSLGGSYDTTLARDAAAVLQMGEDAATPVNQALKAADGSGTDKAGANFTLEGGQGTGTGAGGTLFLATAKARTTASTANPYTNWVSLDANGVLAAGTVVVTNYVRMPWTTLTMTGSNVSSIDFAAASMFKVTLTNDAFFVAPSNLPGTNSAQTIQVHVLQDATGTRTLTMTNSAWVMAGSGTATNAVVALNTNANSVTVLTFVTSPFSATQVYGTLVTPGL